MIKKSMMFLCLSIALVQIACQSHKQEKHEEIKENIRNNTIDLSNIKIDEEKLNLYITYNNLIMAEEAASIEEKQKYLYYLSY